MDRNILLVCGGVAAASALFYGKLPEWSGMLDFGVFIIFMAAIYWLAGPSKAEQEVAKKHHPRRQEHG